MKEFILLYLLLYSVPGIAQETELKFKDHTHRFGKIAEGEVIEHTYVFTNVGDMPVIFNTYKVACACTIVDLPQKPVLPGQQGTIVVHFDTAGKIAYQDREITIFSNAKKSPHKLRFTVNVKN